MGNLPEGIEKGDIEDVLCRACKISHKDIGDVIQNVWCAKNPPGFAFVVFSDRKHADMAVSELDKKEVFGKEIKVEIAREDQGERKPRGRGRGGPRGGPPRGRGGRRYSPGGFRSPPRSSGRSFGPPMGGRYRSPSPRFGRSPPPRMGRDRLDSYDRPPRSGFSGGYPGRYDGPPDDRRGFGGAGRRDNFDPAPRYDMYSSPRDSYAPGGGFGGYNDRPPRRSYSPPPRRSPPPRFGGGAGRPRSRSPPRRGGRGRGRGRY